MSSGVLFYACYSMWIMKYGAWLSRGSILIIIVLSIMSSFHLIEHETLGIIEALLLCCVWFGVSADKKSTAFLYKLLAVLTVILVVWMIHPLLFIYVPAICINLLLAVFFFSTLRPGSEPAITRIARIERDSFDDRLYTYTRGATWAWALFFAALVVEAIYLITFASIESTLLLLNFGNYVFIALFFLAENVCRRIYLRGYTHMSVRALASRLSSRGIMSLMQYKGKE